MIVFKNNEWEISLRKKTMPTMISKDAYFTDENHTFESNELKLNIKYHDESGKLLPKEQWEVEYPQGLIREIAPNGNITYWKIDKKGAVVIDASTIK